MPERKALPTRSGDALPRRNVARQREEEQEETTPTRRGIPAPTVRGGGRAVARSAETDDEPDFTSPKVGGGWQSVAQRKEDYEDASHSGPRDFFLKDGETANVQFLTDEPFIYYAHQIKIGGKWRVTPCQKMTAKRCLICEDNIKKTWKAAFKVADLRGNWDKEIDNGNDKRGKAYPKGGFKYDKPIEKIWVVGSKIADQLLALRTKKNRPLTEMVLEVTRIGEKTNTTYSLGIALDNNDRPIKVEDIVSEHGEIEDFIKPLSDSILREKGFSADED